MKRILLGAVLVLAGCAGENPTEPPAPGAVKTPNSPEAAAVNSWLKRADYPTNIYNAASAAITNASNQSTLYVIGGKPNQLAGEGSITNAVKAYNVSTNTWTAKAFVPVRIRSTNGAAVLNGRIYVSGGYTRRFDEQSGVYLLESLKSLYVYDPGRNSWTRKADMPITTASGLSGVYGGFLYVATSCSNQSYCGERFDRGALFRYNPANNNWVLLSRIPHNPIDADGGFIGSKFYIVSGDGSMDVFDATTRTWTTGPKRPFAFCSAPSATLKAKVYLAGWCHVAGDPVGVYTTLVFNPATASWTQAAAPPIQTSDAWTLSRVVVSGAPRLELVGGDVPGNNWQYVP